MHITSNRLINIICGAAGKATFKPNTSKMAFKQMENTSNFLLGCESLGISKTDLFQTVALYEGTNIPQVVAGIHALGRKVIQLFKLIEYVTCILGSISWLGCTSSWP